MIRRIIALAGGLLATGGTVLALSLPASAATPVGAALNSQPNLALAAPNSVSRGSLAELKTCVGNATCTTGTFKASEKFQQITVGSKTGFELVLNSHTSLCLTDRGGLVFFSRCAGFASQRWTQAANPGALQSVKTGNFLDPVFSSALPYDKLMDGPTHRFWHVLAA